MSAFDSGRLHQSLAAAIASHKAPGSLYHYTDFAGLHGMLTSHRLWATYSKTLNDGSERLFGEQVVVSYLESQLDPQLHTLIQEGLSRLPLLDGYFVSCFCERSDLLSMWRSYAGRGGGYCLEFAGCVLPAFVDWNIKPITAVVKMHYGDVLPPDLGRLLADIAELVKFDSANPQRAMSLVPWIANQIKHPAFFEEQEWRVVVGGPSVGSLKFRSGQSNVKPYVELATAPKKLLPITKVIYGPTLRPGDGVKESLEWMLKQNGYDRVPVERCEIPFRAS